MKNVPQLRFAGFEGEWEIKKVRDIADVKTGKSDTKDADEHGIYPFYIRSDTPLRSNKYLYDEEAVLTIGDGQIGKVFHYVNGKYDLHQRVYRIYNFNYDINSKYFYHYFSKFFLRRVTRMSAKATVDSVRMDMITEMEIKKPKSSDEQYKIANLFDEVDALIEKQEDKVSKMEDFKKSMLQKIFPKKGELVPDFRFEGFENFGYHKGIINDFIVTHGSKNYITNPQKEGEYLVIQQGDIPVAGKSNNTPYLDYKNVILFGDHTLSLYKPNNPFLLSTDGIKIIFIENIDRDFFYYLVINYMPRSQGYKRHYKILRSVEVKIPVNLEEQQKIGQFFKNLDTQIESEEKLLESYKQMKKSLLQKMFV